MPEQNTLIKSKYQGEQGYEYEKEFRKLAKKITDVVPHKLGGVKTTDPEYWGLREVLTIEMVRIANKMKLRKFYTFEELMKMNRELKPEELQSWLDKMSVIGIVEYDYGDNYAWDHPIEDAPKIKRYRICFFVPGSAELMNSSVDRIAKNPAVASFFERMTFIPLAGVTEMIPPGGDGVGMHVIPVEKAIESENKALDIEKISHWLKKYEGHISAGICSCRASRAMLGEGCVDDVDDWCIQLGDMADYTVETGRAHYITKERALEILELSEKNGFVHQITNIDGENKIFDICNCDVKICNALRTALLFNTPNLERSAYTANVTKQNCVACGQCVENCPAGAVKLGQKLCNKEGKEVKYPHAPLPDKIKWGKYAWDENYRTTARLSDTYESGTAPCKVACPAHVPVQGYLKLAHEGKYQEALALIKTQNPLPAVCGRVCNKRCEDACTRGDVDRAVSIDAVKKFVADLDLNSKTRYTPEKIVPSTHGSFDEKIAIIGAGPAGLSAAYYLAIMGFKPTVFEKNKKAGGMLMYGIPQYKLEKDVIEAEVQVIKDLGVEKDVADQIAGVAEEIEVQDSRLQRAVVFASFALLYLYGGEFEPEVSTVKVTETQYGILVHIKDNPCCCLVKIYGTPDDDVPLSLHFGYKAEDGSMKEVRSYSYDWDNPNFFIFFDLARISFLLEDGSQVAGKDIKGDIDGYVVGASEIDIDDTYNLTILEADK